MANSHARVGLEKNAQCPCAVACSQSVSANEAAITPVIVHSSGRLLVALRPKSVSAPSTSRGQNI